MSNRDALWSSGKDETVEVNQRALIDKILARYSGEHTIFRELLQNADDAGAQHVQVKFYTQPGIEAHERGEQSPLPDAKRDNIVRYVVCNDGIPFRPEDWHRLKKIAEGNPDEEKIGAFGVGFYSLWSVCDNPFVESGSKWMGFYWKDGKDQLLARSGDLPSTANGAKAEPSLTGHPWTTFSMELRDPAPLEGPLDFARFLVTSLTFMRTITKIDMMVDGTKVLEVRKDVTGQHKVSRTGLNTTSQMGMMRVQGVESTSMVITARVMQWLSETGVTPPPLPPAIARPVKAAGGFLASFFGRAKEPSPTPTPEPVATPPVQDLNEVDILSRQINTFQADVKVSITSNYAKELERATKKAAPSRMPASLVFSRADESEKILDSKSSHSKAATTVFSGLCPPLDGEKSARVFIGQPTGQTTGIGGHLAARFIPTVERESIDLVDRHVSQWNRELLWVGGYLARLIYELELIECMQAWAKTTPTETAARTAILARGLYALRFFSFRATTPSAAVGQEMERAFFSCSRSPKTMPLVSTAGVLAVDQIRMPNDQLLEFAPDLPVVTPATLTDASKAVARLRERGLLRDITFEDIVKQLGERPLTEKEMIACLKWWQQIAATDGYEVQARNHLLDAAVLITDSSKVVPLSAVKTYVNPQASSIPTDMPLPPDTLPYSVTKDLKGQHITRIFGWQELTLAHYVRFLVNPPMSGRSGSDPETDVRVSAAFSERVLTMLGRAWQSISATQHQAIVAELKGIPMIPTKAGFKVPGEAYFEKNLLFDDLPTIALPKTTAIRGGLEKMLLAIGVRRTVDLQLVFTRLIGGGEWTCHDLMKYLVAVKDNLTAEEINKLRHTAAFPLEQPNKAGAERPATVRKMPSDLYEPLDSMRELGLPLLDWGDVKWRSSSEEARMLFDLGLRRFPQAETLLRIAAGPAPYNERALKFLLDNIGTHYAGFSPAKFAAIPFLPAAANNGAQIMARPGEVFTNKDCTILGFSVARPPISNPDVAAKLGIDSDPSMGMLVSAFLKEPVYDLNEARKIFEYLGTRVGSASVGALAPLARKAFIPVKDGEKTRLSRLDEVYLTSKADVGSLYANAFTFVDFGPRANLFLTQCGVRSEPSHKDIARLLLREPDRMLRQAGSPEKYLDQLRLLAANLPTFDSQLLAEMKSKAFVLGSQLVPKKSKITGKVVDGEFDREWVLCQAKDVVLIDNAQYYQFFGDQVFAAPEEHLMESFYRSLGAQPLSSRVQLEYVTTGQRPPSVPAATLRQHVLERLTIFLGHTGRKDALFKADYLAKGEHFQVVEAQDIKARYTLRSPTGVRQHVETLYAQATRSRSGIVLTVSVTAPEDTYDIAAALCQVLFKSHRAEDALVLDSILATSLLSLKKRGYNVDRILNAQKEERLRIQAEEAKEREAAAAAAVAAAKDSHPANAGSSAAGAAAGAGAAGGAGGAMVPAAAHDVKTQHQQSEEPKMPNEASERLQAIAQGGKGGGFFDTLRKIGRDSGLVRRTSGPSMPGAFGGMGGGMSSPGGGSGSGAGPGRVGGEGSEKHTARPTDVSAIRNVVQSAVAASRPESSGTVQSSKRSVRDVAESQQAYCDSGAEANIKLLREGADGVKLWLPTDEHTLSAHEMDVSARFADHVLKPLARVYGVENSVFNVFWDRAGPLIAFNRGGAVFCNARFYDAWHDEAVTGGRVQDAAISWFFSLAHELAHNLESAHNATHEFYFSSIAEEFLPKFVQSFCNTPSGEGQVFKAITHGDLIDIK